MFLSIQENEGIYGMTISGNNLIDALVISKVIFWGRGLVAVEFVNNYYPSSDSSYFEYKIIVLAWDKFIAIVKSMTDFNMQFKLLKAFDNIICEVNCNHKNSVLDIKEIFENPIPIYGLRIFYYTPLCKHDKYFYEEELYDKYNFGCN